MRLSRGRPCLVHVTFAALGDQAVRALRASLGVLMFDVTLPVAEFWFSLSNLTLVVGVILVAVGPYGVVVKGSAKEHFADERISANEKETARAKESAAQADARAAEANQKAQEASLELARLKAPRGLTLEQRDRIVDKLKQFSGTEYDITVSDTDPEILNFVFTIEVVLSTAGWTELDWKGSAEGYLRGGGQPAIREGVSVTDVMIGVLTDQPPKLFEIALALSDALVAEGVAATASRIIGHAMSSTNANAIHILIGRKT
jgi:hypothetical protein